MSWLKKTIRNWLTRDKLDLGPYERIGTTAPPRWQSPYNFTMCVTQASNGHVLEITNYDSKIDRTTTVTRICPDSTPMMDEIAALIAEFKLR